MGEATSFGPVIYGEILQSGYSVRLGWGRKGSLAAGLGGGHGTNSPGYRPGVPANSNTLLLLGPVQTRQNIVGLIIPTPVPRFRSIDEFKSLQTSLSLPGELNDSPNLRPWNGNQSCRLSTFLRPYSEPPRQGRPQI